jgi:hypothetical protein
MGFLAKVVFARFQKAAFASAGVATPASPIPPARASGEILKKGTAVVTTLIVSADCALDDIAPNKRNNEAVSLEVILFMSSGFC